MARVQVYFGGRANGIWQFVGWDMWGMVSRLLDRSLDSSLWTLFLVQRLPDILLGLGLCLWSSLVPKTHVCVPTTDVPSLGTAHLGSDSPLSIQPSIMPMVSLFVQRSKSWNLLLAATCGIKCQLSLQLLLIYQLSHNREHGPRVIQDF